MGPGADSLRRAGLPTLNWPTVNGMLIIPTASPAAQYFAGLLSHFIDGVFFALLFALLFHPLVPLRNTLLGNLLPAAEGPERSGRRAHGRPIRDHDPAGRRVRVA